MDDGRPATKPAKRVRSMTPASVSRALAVLPATRAEIGAALGVGEMQSNAIARGLIAGRYAEEWESQLTDKGTLAPIIIRTGKMP